jgi:hypothetical protein
MSSGPRSYFDNPFEHNGDVSHASIFLVALILLVGVAAILFYGNALPLPSDSSFVTSNLPGSLSRLMPTPVARSTPSAPAPAAQASAVPTSGGPAAQATAQAPAAPQPAATAGPTATPAAAARPGQTPSPTGPQPAVVANAPNGVFLTRTPNSSDRLIAWGNGTPLQLLGEETDSQGIRWQKVRDPRGNVGWLPQQNVQPLG